MICLNSEGHLILYVQSLKSGRDLRLLHGYIFMREKEAELANAL